MEGGAESLSVTSDWNEKPIFHSGEKVQSPQSPDQHLAFPTILSNLKQFELDFCIVQVKELSCKPWLHA